MHGGRALQLVPAEGAAGTATFTYTVTDGRGSSAPSTATVRVTVRPEGTNAPPEQVRRSRLVVLEPGATARSTCCRASATRTATTSCCVGATGVRPRRPCARVRTGPSR